MDNQPDKILSVDCRSLRRMGNSVGVTFDKEALRQIGVVDDDGRIVGDIEVRQIIHENGLIEVEVDASETPDRPVPTDD